MLNPARYVPGTHRSGAVPSLYRGTCLKAHLELPLLAQASLQTTQLSGRAAALQLRAVQKSQVSEVCRSPYQSISLRKHKELVLF